MTSSQQRFLTIGLILGGVLIVGLFGLRTFHAFREFRGHHPPRPHLESQQSETDVELIRDWMTLPYISMTYGLPPNLLYETLRIPPDGIGKKSLRQLNREYYPDAPGTVLERVKTAILAYQATLTAVPTSTP
jgi:hypothetical protein